MHNHCPCASACSHNRESDRCRRRHIHICCAPGGELGTHAREFHLFPSSSSTTSFTSNYIARGETASMSFLSTSCQSNWEECDACLFPVEKLTPILQDENFALSPCFIQLSKAVFFKQSNLISSSIVNLFVAASKNEAEREPQDFQS